MIKIEKTETYGWEVAIRGMRNPMNSWDKSDSSMCVYINCPKCRWYVPGYGCSDSDLMEGFIIGNADLTLMRKLAAAGTDHSKFMRMINVTCDITAPLYWYKEFDTYKVGTVANSCSTMHKIHAKEFTIDDFSHEHLMQGGIECINNLCKDLNRCRKQFIETNEKEWWWQMIQLLPSSYNQRRTVQLNYAVLRNIYHSRKDHKLDEWKDFCKWIESLPYNELITDKGDV